MEERIGTGKMERKVEEEEEEEEEEAKLTKDDKEIDEMVKKEKICQRQYLRRNSINKGTFASWLGREGTACLLEKKE